MEPVARRRRHQCILMSWKALKRENSSWSTFPVDFSYLMLWLGLLFTRAFNKRHKHRSNDRCDLQIPVRVAISDLSRSLKEHFSALNGDSASPISRELLNEGSLFDRRVFCASIAWPTTSVTKSLIINRPDMVGSLAEIRSQIFPFSSTSFSISFPFRLPPSFGICHVWSFIHSRWLFNPRPIDLWNISLLCTRICACVRHIRNWDHFFLDRVYPSMLRRKYKFVSDTDSKRPFFRVFHL